MNKFSFRTKAWAMLLSSLLIAGLLFLLATVSHVRFDFTQDQVYSLSDSTKSLLENMDEPIMIRAYLTPDLPQPYGRLSRFVEDMLHAYHQDGSSHVGFEVINPHLDPNTAASLTMLGIPKLQVQVIEDDQAQSKQGYLAVVVEYLDQKEVIGVVHSEVGFEYALTNKIKRLIQAKKKKIGFVNAYGSPRLSDLQAFQEVVSADYELVEVNPEEETLSSDFEALIVAGFTQEPSEAMRYALDQFKLKNKGLMILASNAKAALQQGFVVEPVQADVNEWIKDHGIALESGLVMDRQGLRIRLNQQQGRIAFQTLVDYPFIPKISEMDQDHVLSQGLESVSLAFVSPLAWYKGASGSALMTTSDDAAVQGGPPFDVMPLTSLQERFEGLHRNQSLLVLSAEGQVKSAFVDQAHTSREAHLSHAQESRVLVVGSLSLFDNQFMDVENTLFVMNALDWLVHDEELISLRSRGVTQRPLQNLPSDTRVVWKGIWVFFLPMLLLCLGIWRWRRLKV